MTAQERSRVTKARLLDAAGELLELRGPGQVSLDDVCQRAGVAKATFYHHFATKENLLAELAESGSPLQCWFEHAMASEMTTLTLVEATLQMFIGGIARMPLAEVRRFVLEMVTRSVAGSPTRWMLRENLVAVVERGRARGEVPVSWDAHQAGSAIFGIVLTGVIEWLGQGEQAIAGELAPAILERVRLMVPGRDG